MAAVSSKRSATPEVAARIRLDARASRPLATVINTLFGVAFAVVLVRQRFWGSSLADGLVDLAVRGIAGRRGADADRSLRAARLAGARDRGRRVPGCLRRAGDGPGDAVRDAARSSSARWCPCSASSAIDQDEAAYTLGAGRWQTFWRVTLPSIRWGLAYGVTLTIARSLGEFGALLVVSGNILGHTQTATLYIHDGIESFHPEGAYAASVWSWRASRSHCSLAWTAVRRPAGDPRGRLRSRRGAARSASN